MKTSISIDAKGNIAYDCLDMPDPINHQFIGIYSTADGNDATWVQWGNMYLPKFGPAVQSTDAVGEWRIKPAFVHLGWQSLNKMFSYNEKESRQAIEKVDEQWWLD